MNRREFIAADSGRDCVVRSRRARSRASAYAASESSASLPRRDPESVARRKAFEQALDALGWTNGKNLRIDYRWAANNGERVRQALLRSLRALAPDIILTSGTVGCGADDQAAGTIPVVFVQAVDPVGAGFVESLARPGGSATGFTEYGIQSRWEIARAAQGDSAAHKTLLEVIRDPTRGPRHRAVRRGSNRRALSREQS